MIHIQEEVVSDQSQTEDELLIDDVEEKINAENNHLSEVEVSQSTEIAKLRNESTKIFSLFIYSL